MEETKVTTSNSFAVATMSEKAAEQLAGIKLELPQLKIPSAGSTFFEVDEEPLKELQGIIVLHGPRYVYFDKEYEGDSTPPRCSSRDGIQGIWNVDSDDDSNEVVDESGDVDFSNLTGEVEVKNCADCPYSKFGSDKNGRGKACKEKHQIYILLNGKPLPFSLMLPVSSVGVLNAYATSLFNKGKFLNEVLTSFSLEKTTNKTGIVYSKIVMKKVRDLTEEELAACAKVAETVKKLDE